MKLFFIEIKNEYLELSDYIVINCDRLLELPSKEKEDKELAKIRTL